MKSVAEMATAAAAVVVNLEARAKCRKRLDNAPALLFAEEDGRKARSV